MASAIWNTATSAIAGGGSPQKIAISVMRLQQPLEGLQAHELFVPSDFPKKI
jgi:hypothetical protein